jgi:hypothetical protein
VKTKDFIFHSQACKSPMTFEDKNGPSWEEIKIEKAASLCNTSIQELESMLELSPDVAQRAVTNHFNYLDRILGFKNGGGIFNKIFLN